MTAAIKVLVVYQHLPHYRGEVFAELEADPRAEWTFAADLDSSDGSIPTIPAEQLLRFRRLRNHWRGSALWQSGLLGLLVRGRFDAVVFLGDAAFVSTWVGAAICRVRGFKVLFWTIGWHRPDRGFRRHVRLAFYRLANTLLLYGRTAQRIGIDLGYPADRMLIVGNSKSSHEVQASERDTPLALLPTSNQPVVTAVIRLTQIKGLDLLIRAVALLNTTPGPEVIVVLAGEGPERDNLNALARQLRVDVRFLGAVYSSHALSTIYARTTVTVVPLNAGLTCIQSLSYGRPVITTDDPYRWAPESEAIVPGVTGGLYADGSISSLASTIREWITRMHDDGGAVEEACRREVDQHWTPRAQATAVSDAVMAAVHEKRVAA